ncbi:MAG: chemotaxis protein [Candidatus Kapabacteria bacterium]|nr:chemotaxis protein [Candidatus Kapabacteria bacterium]
MKTNILLETGTNELEVVEFVLAYIDESKKQKSQSFGINVAKVREIIRMPELTRLPGLSDTVCGIFRLRDVLIPAIDLTKYLYSVNSYNKNYKMIIAEFNKIRVGLIVSDVSKIHRISWSQIISPESVNEMESENSTVVGIIKVEDKNILMLDIEKILFDIDPSGLNKIQDVNIEVKGKPVALTAEDSFTVRKMVTERLTKAGFELIPFKDGLEAWEALVALAEKSDDIFDKVNIVITDIEMPRMDGYTLTKNIKSHPKLCKLPVVIFSSIISGEMLHKGRSVGVDAQLTKPQIGELLETINLLIEQKSDH